MLKVLIVGGGASGVLVAVNLLRKSDSCEVILVEPNEKLGFGLAYSTRDRSHLLNVPAGRMSGLVEEPRSLCEWAQVDENEFLSRQDYGLYLNFLLERELNRVDSSRFRHIKDWVTGISTEGERYLCTLHSGGTLGADRVVLALGNSDSILPDCFSGLPVSSSVVRDVWREGLNTDFDSAAIVGTGLTFYDIALSILRDRPNAVIHGISRNGLLPSPHLRHRAPALPVPTDVRLSAQGIRDYLSAAGDKWREAQDGIRHDLQEIWAAFPDEEKSTFITQYFRWWNSLRHRSAPEIDEQIKSAIKSRQILIHKASVNSVQQASTGISIELSNGAILEVEQLINGCGNQLVATHPLIQKLIETRTLARGPLGYGVACDPKTLALKDAEGRVHIGIFGIGPILVGELLETTAIPEIRVEADLISKQLLNTH